MPLPQLPRILPPQGFRFVATFSGLPGKFPPVMDSFWQEVSGLSMSVEFEAMSEAGRHGALQLPKGHSYEDLTLKRGFSPGSGLARWVRRGIHDFDFHPAQATIVLFGEKMQPLAVWNCHHVIPVSWSTSALDANSSQVMVETMVLRYESFTFEPGMPNVG